MKNVKTTLFVMAYVVALASLGTVGYIYADYKIKTDKHQTELNEKFHTDVTYVDLPPMNLTFSSSSAHTAGRVRINISLEVDKKYASKVEGYAPRITDRIVSYTQQLDFDEINRPSATKWLREHFLQIANTVSSSAPVIDVVFRQFLIM